MPETKHYRLGLDVGANSIGWCVLELGPNSRPAGIMDLGTRILTATEEAGRDPQTGASLSVDRRIARGMRRRRDRHLLRKADLMGALIDLGLMPAGRLLGPNSRTHHPMELAPTSSPRR